MLWVKNGEKTFQITQFNIIFNANAGKHELWVNRVDGKGVMLVSFEEDERVLEYNEMFTHAIKHGERYVEV